MGGGRGRLAQRGTASPRLALALLLVLGALVAVTPAPVRAATTWTVTSGADTGGDCPGVDCTLRQAIAVAVGGDTIIFAPGLTTVTLTSGGLATANAKDLTIQGGGVVTVTRDAGAGDFSLFQVTAATLELQGLTLTNGKATNLGGAIFNNGGLVRLTNSTVSGNTARFGGGIYTTKGSTASGGTVTLTNSTVSGNTTSTNPGGGIYNEDGSVTLTDSVVSGNTSGSAGGGIFNLSGTVSLTRSALSGNTARGGGGISNGGTLTLTNSTISDNTATDFAGGGISNSGTNTVVFVVGSTISGNKASGTGFDGNGGGVSNNPGTVTLQNSTVSGNTASLDGGGIYNFGTVTLSFVTLTGNSAADQGGGIATVGTSGLPSSTKFDHSIVVGNTGPVNPGCDTTDTTFAPITSQGYNIVGDAGCPSGGTGDLAYNGTLAALLDPTLGNNGGPTKTHALPLGSPAIDFVPTNQCANASGVDQRGTTRPQGPACDTGAVERDLPLVQLTVPASSGGTVARDTPGTGGGPFGYAPGTVVQLTPQPAIGQTFTGWLVDSTPKGWAPSLSITMDAPHTVQATFAPTKTFPDVASGRADFTPITELASRTTIRGYANGNYGPDDGVQRAQMAALIARATSAGPGTPPTILVPPACLAAGTWDCEDWGNGFSDRNGLDANLWRNVGALQHYQVAFGYDGAACAARGVASPCYGPTAPVSYVETVVFITRAMIAKGYWVAQPNAPQPYPGVPAVFGPTVATYHYYTVGAGGVQAPPSNWNAGATRGWFARALWQALNTYWATDGTLPDGRNAGGFAP